MHSSCVKPAVIGIVVVATAAVLILVGTASQRTKSIQGDRFVQALVDYARDVSDRRAPLPSFVTLETLVRSGHLLREDALPFEGVKLLFHMTASESRPQDVLVEASMPDGSVLVVLADGSAQTVTAAAYLQRPQPSFVEAGAFVRAVYTFAEARKEHGQPRTISVQLRELVDSGHITPSVARRFDGSDITLLRRADGSRLSEQLPLDRAAEEVVIRLRLRDGREFAMTADGSIHQSPR